MLFPHPECPTIAIFVFAFINMLKLLSTILSFLEGYVNLTTLNLISPLSMIYYPPYTLTSIFDFSSIILNIFEAASNAFVFDGAFET